MEAAASSARAMLKRLGAGRLPALRSSEASTTPTTTTAMPRIWSAEGRSPRAMPTATGTTTPAVEMGAMMLMMPTARPS